MKTSLFITFLAVCGIASAQTPDWQWAKGAGGNSDDFSNDICTDANGNVFITGSFGSTITFDTITLTGSTSISVFTAKYDSSGNVLWAKSSGGFPSSGYGKGISTDASGNVYVTGYFGSPVIYFGNTTLTNAGLQDIFIVKYDSLGNLKWAKSAGGVNADNGNCISTDDNGNSYVTGFFKSSITFGNTTLFATWQEFFLTKYDSSGNVIWAVQSSGTKNEVGHGISMDTSDNVYVTGIFTSPQSTFGSYTIINSDIWTGGNEVFTAKYDSSGTALWAKSAGGLSQDYGNSISADVNGNSYVAGQFKDSIIFGNDTLISTNGTAIFVAKYDSSGNALWGRATQGTDGYEGHDISTDLAGNCYVTGSYNGMAIFGNDTLLCTNTTTFIVKYDSSGNVIWAKDAEPFLQNVGRGICTDFNGNVYVTGRFDTSVTFGNFMLMSVLGPDIFTVKLSELAPPVANLASGSDTLCEGDCINFTDISIYSPASWMWYFQGGTPATSTAQNPTNICYNTAGAYNVSLVATNIYGSDSITSTNYITVEVCIGVKENTNENTLTIYPNPTTGKFRVESLELGVAVQVYDLLGNLVLATPKREIDLSGYTSGIYFVKVGKRTAKLVLSK